MTVHRLHKWALDAAPPDDNTIIRSAGGGLPRRLTSAGGVPNMLALTPHFLFLQPMEDSLGDLMGGDPLVWNGPGPLTFGGPSEVDGSRYLRMGMADTLTLPRTGLFDPMTPWSLLWRYRRTSIPAREPMLFNVWSAAGASFGLSVGVYGFVGVQWWDAAWTRYSWLFVPYIDAGVFSEYLLTWDGLGSAGKLRLFVNGIEATDFGEGNWNGFSNTPGGTDTPLTIGSGTPDAAWGVSIDLDLLAYYGASLESDPSRFILPSKAKWSRTFDKAATLRSVIVPGTITAPASVLVGAADPVTVPTNDADANVDVPAGSNVTVEVGWSGGGYIASPLGEGPAIVYEEAASLAHIVPTPTGTGVTHNEPPATPVASGSHLPSTPAASGTTRL